MDRTAIEGRSDDLFPALHALRSEEPEFEEALAALKADAILGPVVGKLVGESGGGSLVEADRLASGLLTRAWFKERTLLPSRQALAEAVESVRRPLLIGLVTQHAIAPLPGRGFHSENLPIVLEPVHIRGLDDSEVSAVLSSGLRFVDPFGFANLQDVGEGAAFVAAYELPFGPKATENEPDEQAFRASEGVRAKAEQDIEEVIVALRLLKSGPISVTGIVHVGSDPLMGGVSMRRTSLRRARPPRDDYNLVSDQEVERLREIWTMLRSEAVRESLALSTAIRRFSQSTERANQEDRLIDLVIAAESLFAGDTQPGDLSLRVAIRFAYYADNPGWSRRELYDHMRAAYDGRSQIVHANRRTARVQRKIDRAVNDLNATEDLMRAVILRQMQASATRGEPVVIDWDSLILGSE